MSSVLEPPPSGAAGSPRRQPRTQPAQVLAFLALALGLGAAAGVLWWRLVDLPGYLVRADGKATTTERGLADFVAGDAWFTLLGGGAGLLLGTVGWLRLRSVGWPVVLLVAGSALVAALVCWLVGYRLGPGDFNTRLAAAGPGDLVQIQLTLRARASLLVWPFAATVPVLLGSSLGRDHEEPAPRAAEPLFALPRSLLRRRRRSPEPAGDRAQPESLRP